MTDLMDRPPPIPAGGIGPHSYAPGLVVLTNDELLGRGIESFLEDRCPIPPPGHIGCALVDLRGPGDVDRLQGTHQLLALGQDPRLALVPVVALLSTRPSLAAQLRMVESGADHFLGLDTLSADPTVLVRLASDLAPTLPGLTLPDRDELRWELGLRAEGDVSLFVESVRSLPTESWCPRSKQAALPLSRRMIIRVRRLAYEVAGMPPPDPTAFSTAYRRAPLYPEWSAVRALVADLLDLDCRYQLQ